MSSLRRVKLLVDDNGTYVTFKDVKSAEYTADGALRIAQAIDSDEDGQQFTLRDNTRYICWPRDSFIMYIDEPMDCLAEELTSEADSVQPLKPNGWVKPDTPTCDTPHPDFPQVLCTSELGHQDKKHQSLVPFSRWA